MKKIILVIVIMLSNLTLIIAQNTFLIGEKTYPCTPLIYFPSDGQYLSGNLIVLIAKNEETGMIVVSISVDLNTNNRIKGNIIIYLDNNTIITCIDRNKFDIVNDFATTIYYLTKDEINKLKNINIQKIRFTIEDKGSYTASNNLEPTDVPKMIKELFK